MINENEKFLFKRVNQEFKKLRSFVFKSYRDREVKDIRRFDNLFKGFKDYNKKLDKKKLRPYLHPYKIDDYEVEIDDKKLPTKQEINKISTSIRKLRKPIKCYYETEGKGFSIRFEIETAYRGGEYRLKAKIADEDFEKVLNKIRKQKIKQGQSTIDEKQILDKYLKWVEGHYRDLPIEHIGIIPPVPIAIEDSYVHLKATLDESVTEASYWPESLGKSYRGLDDYVKEKRIAVQPPSQPLPIEQILQKALKPTDPFSRGIILLGASGSGKSTFLKYFSHSVASGKVEELGLEGFIPVFIDLPRYSESKYSDFIDYCLKKTVSRKNDRRVLWDIIEESDQRAVAGGHGVIFLLDALDEVRFRKKEIVEEIESKAIEYKNALFIVTSRKIGYYELPLNNTFKRYLIEELTEEEIPNFVRKWFDIVVKGKDQDEPGRDWNKWAEEKTDYLLHELDSKPSLKRICTTPLYLTFLVLSASIPHTRLPETRAELFDRYFDVLIVNWEKNMDYLLIIISSYFKTVSTKLAGLYIGLYSVISSMTLPKVLLKKVSAKL